MRAITISGNLLGVELRQTCDLGGALGGAGAFDFLFFLKFLKFRLFDFLDHQIVVKNMRELKSGVGSKDFVKNNDNLKINIF